MHICYIKKYISMNLYTEQKKINSRLTSRSGYIRNLLNRKIISKGSIIVNFALGFVIIIKNVNLRLRNLLKVRIPMQNQRFPILQINFSVRRAADLPAPVN
jgi:hypothetical protein